MSEHEMASWLFALSAGALVMSIWVNGKAMGILREARRLREEAERVLVEAEETVDKVERLTGTFYDDEIRIKVLQ